MEPLQELFDLYEAMVKPQPKPELMEPEEPGIGTPQRGYEDHPVIQNKKAIDALRASGVSAVDAHQQVNGLQVQLH